MKILIDAMGGDHAPLAPVTGALEAASKWNVPVVLVGRENEILAAAKEAGYEALPAGVEIRHADDVVDMHDDPARVIQRKKNSSMVVGLKMLSDGEGDAFISAGSTGALLSGATLVVKRVKGIRRAAMAPAFPNKAGGRTIICDCGANAECTPEFLLQFAIVGSLHARKSLGIQNPRVGLLNIGTEDSKGTALQLATYPMLADAHEKGLINFIGNVEARQVPLGEVDVVVCDGFSGNVLLKSIEGTAMFLGSTISAMFQKSIVSKLAAALVMKDIKAFKKLLDYREIGGTQFVGIKKPVIKAHGSSDARAFYNAVRQAVDAANNNTAEELEIALKQISTAKEKA